MPGGFKSTFGLTIAASSIFREDGLSFFKKLIGKPGEVLSPHCAIHDEFHEHKTSEQVDSMDTGMGVPARSSCSSSSPLPASTRRAPARSWTTTRPRSWPRLRNEQFFTLAYGIDDSDDWTDFEVWKKANPNFGVSVSEEYLRGKLAEAIQRTSLQNTVKTKHLNCWVNAVLAGSTWRNGTPTLTMLELERFEGCKAWIGIDLLAVQDRLDGHDDPDPPR